jgi:hypothetical protein
VISNIYYSLTIAYFSICQEQEDALIQAAAVEAALHDPVTFELEDWISRLSMRGVAPAIIAAQNCRVLAATRTDQLTGDQDQLPRLREAVERAKPGDAVTFAGIK